MQQLILFLFLFTLTSFGQSASQTKKAIIDSVRKHHCIYVYTHEIVSTKNARSMFIDFRVGVDGAMKNIGRKGKSLENVIKNDTEAYKELKRAYKVHLRRKRTCNTLEYISYGITAASAFTLFFGLSNYKSDGVTPPLILGGIGTIGGYSGIILFRNLTNKHMTAFSNSINQSITLYNTHLLTNIK